MELLSTPSPIHAPGRENSVQSTGNLRAEDPAPTPWWGAWVGLLTIPGPERRDAVNQGAWPTSQRAILNT